jgi:hypothetical protein
MKYLSHFTLRAFVVIGLSLGCAKAQLSKEEVMLYFKDIDMKKVTYVSEYSGSWVEQGTYPSVKQDYSAFYDKEKKKVPIKVMFYENSLVFTYGPTRRLYSYQHIKRISHFKEEGGERIWIK